MSGGLSHDLAGQRILESVGPVGSTLPKLDDRLLAYLLCFLNGGVLACCPSKRATHPISDQPVPEVISLAGPDSANNTVNQRSKRH